MRLFASRLGTAVWLFIALGTAALAVARQDVVTAAIAIGWFAFALFSYNAYRDRR